MYNRLSARMTRADGNDLVGQAIYNDISNKIPLNVSWNLFSAHKEIYNFTSHGSRTHPLSITITEINSAFVKGTFNGELEGTGVQGAIERPLFTKGTFNVKF